MDEDHEVWTYLVIFFAEFSGTAFLLYFGCLGLIEFKLPLPLPDLQAALVWGTTISAVIMMFGHITRAHFNPAVTFCALILRIISPVKSMVYFIAQMTGATAGYSLLTITVPSPPLGPLSWGNNTNGFCNTVLRSEVTPLQGILAEFMGTSMLIYAVCSAWDPRNSIWSDSVSIKFGFVIVTLVIGIGPLTGASLNPARSFGPALINGVWKNHWVYWVATLGASMVTTLIYRYVYLPEAHYVLQAKDKLSDQMRQGSLYSKGEDTGKLMPKKAAVPTPAPGPIRY